MFNYALPPEKIAQRPTTGPRENARLLADTDSGPKDCYCYDLAKLLAPNSLLVLNDTKVMAYRFFLQDDSEIFLIRQASPDIFQAIGRPFRRFKVGAQVGLSNSLRGEIIKIDAPTAELTLRILNLHKTESLENVIANEGNIPIPPYIREGRSDALDKEQYQTVFATKSGSIAAPTASLHFSDSLLDALSQCGIRILFVTLHVGLSSILPVERQSKGVSSEEFVIGENPFRAIQNAKKEGRSITAVGTTVVRALESLSKADWDGAYDYQLRPTGLFIQPGFKFQTIDRLVTNFHQSGSTHLSLVSAFSGSERVKALYDHALKSDYKFLSYGDAMFLTKRI